MDEPKGERRCAVGVGPQGEPIFEQFVRLGWANAEVVRLKAELAEAKRLYDLRGMALRRPCLQCGYEPLKITLADGSMESLEVKDG